MKIISIDVGMKHLAYCIFYLDTPESKEYQVIDWNVIDLCKSKTEHKCFGFLKNKKPCSKTPSYFKNDKYFCKTHAKKQQFLIPTQNLNKTKLSKMKIKKLKEICLAKKAKKQDYIDLINKDLDDNYFELIKKIDSRSINIVTYGIRIKEEFEKLLKTIDIDCVLIENQIGPLALRMKMLQGMIMQHFIENKCTNINEISPANKLKEFTDKKTTYKERKFLSIKVTREIMISENYMNKWIDHFNTHKKKDDLADAFLQGLWFIKNN
jgi:hypothetical protein